jgi:hypothetical protein
VEFAKVALFSKVEVDVAASASGTLTIATDLPGTAMAIRCTLTVPATTRRPVGFRLPYSTLGHLVKATYNPGTGQSTLFGARIWARALPDGVWQWYPLPVVETPNEFSPQALPIPVTPEEWTGTALPIPATPNEFSPQALPIPATPEEWTGAALPIPATPEEWTGAVLPVIPTPSIPDWVDLEVDA